MKYISIGLSFVALVIAFLAYNNSVKPVVAKEEKDFPYLPEEGRGYINAKSLELPGNVQFAGEKVPMQIPDVRERFDRELHINTYWHNNTIFLIKRAHRWFPEIEKILKSYNVPDDFKYLAVIEGGFKNQISPSGAVGFWQFMKGASKDFGLEISRDVDERYDPIKSTHAACKYLNKAYAKFGNWTDVAASYNRGMTGVQKTMDKQGESSYYDLLLPEETARYVFRILAVKEIFENPTDYGFEIDSTHLYQPEQLKYVEVSEDIPDLVDFSKSLGINYKLLKRYNPWLRNNKLTIQRGKTYSIAIPVQ